MPFKYCPECGRQNADKKFICPNCGYSLNDGTFEINGDVLVKYKGNDTNIEVPNIIKVIGKEAFSNNDKVVSIILPYGITTIRGYAFSNCINLKDVFLPDSIEKIEKYAFYGCSSLESINLPKKINNIDEGVFESCKKLQSIILPDNVKTIGEHSFRYCHGLVSISFPKGMYDNGYSYAFVGCDNLINIVYRGPKNNWRYIDKWIRGNRVIPAVSVHCEDGDIDI